MHTGLWKYLNTLLCMVMLFSCQPKKTEEMYDLSWSVTDRILLVNMLQGSFESLLKETVTVENEVWFAADSGKWSIAEVVEHLIIHDELFYREVNVLTKLPPLPKQAAVLFATDSAIFSYSEITTANYGKSLEYLEPMGRWCSKEQALEAYSKKRAALISFVESTDQDLRKYYTKSGRGPTTFRDLHQLLYISVAHTVRHTTQIKKIKKSTLQQL